jgi:hypothetical protein
MVIGKAVLGVLSIRVMDVTTSHGGTQIDATSMYDANDIGLTLVAGLVGGAPDRRSVGLSIFGGSLRRVGTAATPEGPKGPSPLRPSVVPAEKVCRAEWGRVPLERSTEVQRNRTQSDRSSLPVTGGPSPPET